MSAEEVSAEGVCFHCCSLKFAVELKEARRTKITTRCVSLLQEYFGLKTALTRLKATSRSDISSSLVPPSSSPPEVSQSSHKEAGRSRGRRESWGNWRYILFDRQRWIRLSSSGTRNEYSARGRIPMRGSDISTVP